MNSREPSCDFGAISYFSSAFLNIRVNNNWSRQLRNYAITMDQDDGQSSCGGE